MRPATDRADATPAAVAIGNFDGVHRGHLAILSALDAAAGRLGVERVVYTFNPAPTAVVAPDRHQARMQTLDSRVALLLASGADRVEVERFTPEFAKLPAEVFARRYLVERLAAKVLVVGHDFRFGNMRGGDTRRLREWLPGVEIIEVGALSDAEGPISSSRIRKLLVAGNVEGAARLLGRPHQLTGTVVHGEKRGRTIGFPTANLGMREELRPAPGVYAAAVKVGEVTHLAAVNLGFRPTVGGTAYSVEAHLLDFSGDLYGAELALDLVARVRDERKFSGIDALKAQIAADVQLVRGRSR